MFYTNYKSDKVQHLDENNKIALVFHWDASGHQVRMEGQAVRSPAEESDAYFATRDLGSQLGAWASDQSRPLKSRATLLKRVVALEARHIGRDIPRPAHWSGLRVVPHMIEFWIGRSSRLHDRFRYTRGEDGWDKQRLYP